MILPNDGQQASGLERLSAQKTPMMWMVVENGYGVSMPRDLYIRISESEREDQGSCEPNLTRPDSFGWQNEMPM